MGKQVKSLWIAFALAFVQMLCCCSSSDGDETPEIVLSDISGTWVEYAYLSSDGYFIDISDVPSIGYYEFTLPSSFNQYTIVDGQKDYSTQGTWTYDPDTKTAYIKESRGWDLYIAFDFKTVDDATLSITGKTVNQNRTIKAKRTSR